MLYTINEVAAILRLSRWTVRKMVDNHEIPAIKLGERSVRIDSDELRNYLAKVATSAPTAK